MGTILWDVVCMFATAALVGGIVWMCTHNRDPVADTAADQARARYLLAKVYGQYDGREERDYLDELLGHKLPRRVTMSEMGNYTDLVAKLEVTAGVSDPTKVLELIKDANLSDEAKWGQLHIWLDQVELRAYLAHMVNQINVSAPKPDDAMRLLRQKLHRLSVEETA